jgi:hypothetical protein
MPEAQLTPRAGQTRAAIIEAALRLFRETGYEAATMRAIAWLYSLGIVMFWVHDTSPGCAKTYDLIDRTMPLADRLVSMSRLPVLHATLADVISIIEDLRG